MSARGPQRDHADLELGAGYQAGRDRVPDAASAIPASRTNVTPAASVRRSVCAVSSTRREIGVRISSSWSKLARPACRWQSKMPGSSQSP